MKKEPFDLLLKLLNEELPAEFIQQKLHCSREKLLQLLVSLPPKQGLPQKIKLIFSLPTTTQIKQATQKIRDQWPHNRLQNEESKSRIPWSIPNLSINPPDNHDPLTT